MSKVKQEVDVHQVYKDDMISFGKWVQTNRKERGISLEKLSEICGIDKSYIHRLEKGERSNPSFITVFALATTLGKDIRDIITMK